MQESDDVDDDHDLITLHGCGIITKWRFPHVKKCPIKYCGNEFENRSAAIDHFKMLHVMNTIYCPLCCEPCCANFPTDFKQHYQVFHQKHKMPYSFDEGMDDSAASRTKKITKRTLSAIRAPRTRKKITVVYFSFV